MREVVQTKVKIIKNVVDYELFTMDVNEALLKLEANELCEVVDIQYSTAQFGVAMIEYSCMIIYKETTYKVVRSSY